MSYNIFASEESDLSVDNKGVEGWVGEAVSSNKTTMKFVPMIDSRFEKNVSGA